MKSASGGCRILSEQVPRQFCTFVFVLFCFVWFCFLYYYCRFVFPYAGGAPNTFSSWGLYLPESVEMSVIFLPGRMSRSNLAPIRDWRELASKIGDAILSEVQTTKRQYAMYKEKEKEHFFCNR
jgi:hypothetical protein